MHGNPDRHTFAANRDGSGDASALWKKVEFGGRAHDEGGQFGGFDGDLDAVGDCEAHYAICRKEKLE